MVDIKTPARDDHGQVLELHQVATEVAGATDLDTLLNRCIEMLSSAYPSSVVFILLAEEESGELVTRASSDERVSSPDNPRRVRIGEGITGWVAEHGKTVLVNDVSQDARYIAIDPDARAELCVPLMMNERVFGVINLEKEGPDGYSQSDRNGVETFAQLLALALSNLGLHGDLARAESQHNALLKASADAIVSFDRQSGISLWNPAAEKMFGYQTDEVRGQPFERLIMPEEHAGFRRYIEKPSQGNTRVLTSPITEFTARHSDGTPFPIELSMACHRLDGREEYLAVVRNVADRKAAEQTLYERRRTLQTVITSMPNALLVVGEQDTVSSVYVPQHFPRLITADRVRLGSRVGDLLPEDLANQIELALKECRAAGRTDKCAFEHRLPQNGAGVAYLSVRIAPVSDSSDMLIVIDDVTPRKQIEERLSESLSLLGTTLEATADAILVTDLEGSVTTSNRRFVEMWAVPENLLSAEDGPGLSLFEWMVEQVEKPDFIVGKVEELSGEPEAVGQGTLRLKDGRVIEFISTPQRLDEAVIGRVWTFRDVTDRVLAQDAELEQRLLAEALHDAALILSSTLDLDEVLERLLAMTANVARHSGANIMLLDPEENTVRVVKYCECYEKNGLPKPRLERPLPLDELPHLAQMAEDGQPCIIADTEVDPAWQTITKEDWMKSYACAPITANGKVVGFLNMDSDTPGFFTQAQVEHLKAFADQAAVAIQNAQLHAAAQESEERFRTLFERLPDAVNIIDPLDRTIVDCNEATCSMNGYTREELIGQSIDILHQEEASQEEQDSFRERLQVERSFTGEALHKHKDGTIFPIQFTTALFNFRGRQMMLGIDRDITESKKMEEALRESERRYRRIVEGASDVVYTTDAEGRFVYMNAPATRLTGYSEDELLGMDYLDLVAPKWKRRVQVHYLRQIQGKVQETIFELPIIIKSGEERWIEQSLTLLTDGDQVTGYQGIVRDVTERKQMEDALAQARDEALEASRLKSEFLANMSHEIRTPLNAVIGMTGLLLDTRLNAEQQDYVETVRSSGDTLLSLINDILDFSKIEAGKMELENQPFELRTAVEEALDVIAPKAADKGLELAYLIEETVPTMIVGDVTRVRQVLVNLLGNAVKFTEEGEITVIATGRGLPQPGRYEVRFEVKDTGIGIPEEARERLFKSFSQVDASTTRRYGGTGLGLAISKRLVEMMGGSIWVESVLGEGSTFQFTIQAAAAPSRGRVRRLESLPKMRGKRILIVDDNETNRYILARQLDSWGMRPIAVESGRAALDLIKQGESYDIAILDMQMPEMDGAELAAEIRKRADTTALPLVVLSSLGSRQEDVEGVEFAAYLTKPVKSSRLFDVLTSIFAGDEVNTTSSTATHFRYDAEMATRHPLRILLAEDNLVNQKVALRMLERMGYRADVAANGLEAIEAVLRQQYDVVLMDVQMPEMDGLEATRHIRNDTPPAYQPHIIALTAHALSGDRERLIAQGMDDYISKPVRAEELVRALEQAAPATNRDREAGAKVAEPEESMIDPTALGNLIDMVGEGNQELFTDLVDTLEKEAARLLPDLSEAIASGNAEQARHAAHTLKGSCASMGATELAHLCFEMEMKGKSGDLTGALEILDQIEAMHEKVIEALRAIRI
ncbi:MAG: PAS domain S-box protein [Chloroflexota bacterium]